MARSTRAVLCTYGACAWFCSLAKRIVSTRGSQRWRETLITSRAFSEMFLLQDGQAKENVRTRRICSPLELREVARSCWLRLWRCNCLLFWQLFDAANTVSTCVPHDGSNNAAIPLALGTSNHAVYAMPIQHRGEGEGFASLAIQIMIGR